MLNKNILVPFVLLVVLGAGCGASQPAPTPVQPTPQPSVSSLQAEQAKGPYTLADVAKHSTEQDCWMVISGKVYDVTAYIPMHPGGGNRMAVGCGKDATSYFNQRPDGISHSDRARAILDQYYISDLKTTQ
jgi:cytochrome b involved in lipid metabolism